MGVTVPTAVFNQFLQDIPADAAAKHRHEAVQDILWCYEKPPAAEIHSFVNKRSLCPRNYLLFLENQIRRLHPGGRLADYLGITERESPQGESQRRTSERRPALSASVKAIFNLGSGVFRRKGQRNG